MNETDLQPLANRINKREEKIESLYQLTLRGAEQAVSEAILQGRDLSAFKESLKHGEWLKELRTRCPKISVRRAQRYMALASKAITNAPTAAHLEGIKTLHAALVLWGM